MAAASRARAFATSNAIVLAASLPALLLPAPPLASALAHGGRVYLSTVARMAVVVALLSSFAKARHRPASVLDVARMMLVAAPIETATALWALRRYMAAPGVSVSWLRGFVPLLFAFEVIFDLFHYLAHRAMHSNTWLYVYSGHKTHHTKASPVPLDTYCQHPVDVLLSNAIPMVAALHILDWVGGWRFSPAQLHLLMGYKTFTEVAGHVGNNTGRATSFPLCVYLPRLLGIELRTRDHDWHHSGGGRSNFAKRFTLWDKLGGTYEDHQ